MVGIDLTRIVSDSFLDLESWPSLLFVFDLSYSNNIVNVASCGVLTSSTAPGLKAISKWKKSMIF